MRVRSLLAPPGIPEFLPRIRRVDPGTVALEGRAWSGNGEIVRVEVTTDDRRTWAEADLGPPIGTHAWRPFTFTWNADPATP